jgi:type IV pilus assembly protein PilW
MMTSSAQRRRRHGFSLVELLVSIVVGLLAIMFATKLFANSEQNRQASLGGSATMQNGMQALFSITKDAAQAGWGLNDPLVAGCDTVFSDTKGYQLTATARGGVAGTITPLAAAVIESNGANPDRLTLYAGSSITGSGEVGLGAAYTGGDTLQVDRIAFGFLKDDVILVVPESNLAPAPKCALAQISAAPVVVSNVQSFKISAGTDYRFNRAAGLGDSYKGGVTRVFNLGPSAGLAFHVWSVDSAYLRLRASDLAGAGAQSQPVIDNIVSLKAQYGFDDISTSGPYNPEGGMQVRQWSATMIDADGDGIIGGAGDYQRIAALRVAVVARSRQPERPAADGSCAATPSLPVVFGTAAPAGVAAAAISVNVTVAGDPISWKCSRYRVFESIVPMRNLAWRPTNQ